MTYNRQRSRCGRIRIKLAALLREHGIDVEPENLWVQEGGYRSWDLARWGSDHVRWADGRSGLYRLFSWDTMTVCVRRGITVEAAYHQSGALEVHAKPPKPSTTE